MQTLWMGVRPGPDRTRVLVQDGPIPILKARLPEAPRHPLAPMHPATRAGLIETARRLDPLVLRWAR